MDVAAFKAIYPQLKASDAQILDALARGATRVDATIFGDTAEEAIGLWAAHSLTSNPGGLSSRFEGKDPKTPFSELFDRLLGERTCFLRAP